MSLYVSGLLSLKDDVDKIKLIKNLWLTKKKSVQFLGT